MSVIAFKYTLQEKELEEKDLNNAKNFEKIFKAYYPRLIFFANKYVNNLSVAEEIVSDTFTYLWENRADLTILSSVNAYVYKMVQNRSLNYLKHKKIENEYVNYLIKNNLLAENLQANNDSYQQKDLERHIQKAVEELPERCREIFKMSRFGHLKNKEIAQKLNISHKTVERQMTIALERMRHYLKHLFVVISSLLLIY